jgi:1,4-alpha-glucan branching enzyme
MALGHLLLHLHAHLPYVRHPEVEVFLEEAWLFEAITETYIPLLSRFEALRDRGIPVRLSMTWTPSLCEMLVDPLLQARYRRHLGNLLALAEQEVPAKAHTPYAAAAVMYRDHFRFCFAQLDRWHDNLLAWVRRLAADQVLEPITCGATHGFLPLMASRIGQRAQIQVARANYRKHFGRDPQSIWLPECGYQPGVDDLLQEEGLRSFFVDTHSVYFGTPRPRHGCYAPVITPAGVAAFARDPDSSRSVWSSQGGYPGQAVYREFYRDLGYDGDYAYVRRHLHPDGIRRNLGLKYHRITGAVALHEKEPYQPAPAFLRAMADADDFVRHRVAQCRHLHRLLRRSPLIVCPYDAELFGHWWFEGPQFLESIFCVIAGQSDLTTMTASDYLQQYPVNQMVAPCASTWGDHGYNGVWLNPTNDWIYRHLHRAELRMQETARRHPAPDPWQRRALNQMARELLLAQSSDWAFILTTGSAPAYATRRIRDHINRFTGLYEMLAANRMEREMVERIEWHDPIFQEIDYRVYA